MRRIFKEIKVTSLQFEDELKNQFTIRASRRAWCHWILIRRISPLAYTWHARIKDGVDVFEYENTDYTIVYADNLNRDSILESKSIGVSMRVFTDTRGLVNYIAVVTRWKEK